MLSVTGQNLCYLMIKFNLHGIDELFEHKSKLKSMKVNPLTVQENWKVNMLQEVALLRKTLTMSRTTLTQSLSTSAQTRSVGSGGIRH